MNRTDVKQAYKDLQAERLKVVAADAVTASQRETVLYCLDKHLDPLYRLALDLFADDCWRERHK